MASLKNKIVYSARYEQFETSDKKDGAKLVGPDNAIVNIGTIVIESITTDAEKLKLRAFVQNSFGQRIGYLSDATSSELAAFKNKGWHLSYILSLVAFSEQPKPERFWGEIIFFVFDPSIYDEIEVFISRTAQQVAQGKRPNIDLSDSSLKDLISAKGAWDAGGHIEQPPIDKHTAILKSSRSFHDKLLDGARSKNPGCLIVGWLFILGIASLIIYVLYKGNIL